MQLVGKMLCFKAKAGGSQNINCAVEIKVA
jgi:hypothetical protein